MLPAHPQRSIRKGAGKRDLQAMIAGAAVRPGDGIYADAVLVSRENWPDMSDSRHGAGSAVAPVRC